MANSVDPDEMAHYEPSHPDIHCLYRYWFWSVCRDERVNWSLCQCCIHAQNHEKTRKYLKGINVPSTASLAFYGKIS